MARQDEPRTWNTKNAMIGSPYQIMWLIAMFDLPVKTKQEKKDYLRFQKFLLLDGFTMMQYSVYMRCCPSPENAEAHLGRVNKNLPPEGEVRVMEMTDKQFGRMRIFQGKMRKPAEKAPTQLTLF